MSYDGYIVHAPLTEGAHPYAGYGVVEELGNSTCNHSRVWSRALVAAGFRDPDDGSTNVLLSQTSGMTCRELAPIFAAAAKDARFNWQSYDEMHPRDRITLQRIEWYDLEQAVKFLETAAEACEKYARYDPPFRVYWSS